MLARTPSRVTRFSTRPEALPRFRRRSTRQTPLLAELFYVDADDTFQCRRNGGVAAFTVPGSRVVHVCAKRFGHFVPNTNNEEIVLIHELLHTLGLGENPPTSSHITKAVQNRCR